MDTHSREISLACIEHVREAADFRDLLRCLDPLTAMSLGEERLFEVERHGDPVTYRLRIIGWDGDPQILEVKTVKVIAIRHSASGRHGSRLETRPAFEDVRTWIVRQLELLMASETVTETVSLKKVHSNLDGTPNVRKAAKHIAKAWYDADQCGSKRPKKRGIIREIFPEMNEIQVKNIGDQLVPSNKAHLILDELELLSKTS